jgi:PIN domain nuclease of toxin-antitoxin system
VILLDTHVLIWAAIEPNRLSRAATAALRRAKASDGLAIASITLWETASLFSRRRIEAYSTVEASVRQVLDAVGVVGKPLTLEVAVLATQFAEDYSHDPADRIIGATARAEGLALVTKDEGIRRSPLVKTIW